jgi:hypothetical protein
MGESVYRRIVPNNAVVNGQRSGEQRDITILPRDYYDKMRSVVDEQLEKAGIRLEVILEEVFK